MWWGQAFHVESDAYPALGQEKASKSYLLPFFFLEVIKPLDDLQHRICWRSRQRDQGAHFRVSVGNPLGSSAEEKHRISSLAARPAFCSLSSLVSVLVFQK